MIYGLYLSATGITTNAHQQDVIANNIANSDTDGFKRSLALVQAREVEARAIKASGLVSNPLLDRIGGGQFLSPTHVDFSQGIIEQTGNPLDVALNGPGFLAVGDENQVRLSRAGALMIDPQGRLITAQGHPVLDVSQRPINLKGIPVSELSIGSDGQIRRGQETLARISLVDSDRPDHVKPIGENLFTLTGDAKLIPARGKLVSGSLEKSNVEPAVELTRLMETQRLLEANATLIKYQDATLSKLVNEVGKIG
ncbi:MAG: flagellar basal body protein [Phycisphaerae bacterium]|jgi:flagellar basal body rod protein FlgG|nr:MAG: flagellar basal body protein [Phycisphaerae bacterium]